VIDPQRADSQRTNRHRANSNSSRGQPEDGHAHQSTRFRTTFPKHALDLTAHATDSSPLLLMVTRFCESLRIL
jgi:hypothetical protein